MPRRLHFRERLAQIARAQQGYFTAAQARQAGYSYQAQRHHVAAGNWIRVDRGIFRLRDWPEPLRADLVRWTLWTRRRAVVSHDTAVALHGLGDVNPPFVHLTVPSGFRPQAPGVVLHEATLPESDIESREGFRVTTPLRSLLDFAASDAEPDQVARAVRDALAHGLATAGALRDRADEFGPVAALRIERALRGVP